MLIPSAQHEAWYAHASAVPGLNNVELGVLSAIAASYRQMAERALSYDRMAHHLNVDPVSVKWAVYKLVDLGLVAVQPGSGTRANTYLLALPRRVAALLSSAAADRGIP